VTVRLCATPACLHVVVAVISKSNSCAPIALRGTTVMAIGSAGCLRPIASDVVELLQHWREGRCAKGPVVRDGGEALDEGTIDEGAGMSILRVNI
jgi:hypothetical protein